MTLSKETLARRIREALDNSGLRQQDLAEAIGMDEEALSKALQAKRNLSSLEAARIAQTLHIPTNILFADD